MVHFPAYSPNTLFIHVLVIIIPDYWVTPFGNLGIIVCWRLPQAFRSYPRPSSPGSS